MYCNPARPAALIGIALLGIALGGCALGPTTGRLTTSEPVVVQAAKTAFSPEVGPASAQTPSAPTQQHLGSAVPNPTSTGPVTQVSPTVAAIKPDPTKGPLTGLPQTPRFENLIDRITSGFAMPELHSPLVATHERWIQRNPEYLNRVFERGGKYLHHIVEELEARNLPTELALLPIVESAFNPQALSSAKAAGLWQFIPSTGRAFDLQQDWWLDQRRDVIESTRAALDYLQKIYELQDNDWFLALASYNWGEGAVLRARKRNEAQRKPTDYLSLKMPRETQNYVPKLIALRNVLSRPKEFGVSLPVIENKPYFVIIDKEQSIDLKLAASFADMTVAEFTELNPSHNRPVISASRTNRIILPAERADVFQERLSAYLDSGKPLVTWKPYTLKADETLAGLAKKTNVSLTDLIKANSLRPNAKPLPGTVLLAPVQAQSDEPSIETTLARFSGPRVIERETIGPTYHRVRQKETLSSIARRYGVTQDGIRSLNPSVAEIEVGMRLLIRPAQTRTVMTNEQGVKQVISTAKAASPAAPAPKAQAQQAAAQKSSAPQKSSPQKATAQKTSAPQKASTAQKSSDVQKSSAKPNQTPAKTQGPQKTTAPSTAPSATARNDR